MKKVLIFIQDQHELKKLTHVRSILDKFNLNMIDVATCYKSKDTRDFIESKLDVLQYIDVANLSVKRLDKFKYRINQLCFFIKNKKYNSCRQKIYEFFGYSKKQILSDNIDYASRIAVKILVIISGIINCRYLNIAKNKSDSSRVYDYIVFIRSDSVKNSSVASSFSSESTKIITIVRNIDTPLLKGPYIVNSDYTFCSYDFEYNILSQVGAQYTGELSIVQSDENIGHDNRARKQRSVLICLAAEWMIERQERMVESIILHIPSTISIYLKLHSSSGNKYFYLEDKYANVYIHGPNPVEDSCELQTIESIKELENLLEKSDVLLAYGSTMALEASKYGVESYFISVEQNMMYQREHLMWMCKSFVSGFVTMSFKGGEYEIVKSDLEFCETV